MTWFHRSLPTSMPRCTASLAGTALLLVAAAGCSAEGVAERIAEEAAEQAGAGEVDIDLDEEGGVGIDTDEGSLRAGGGELPDSFPETVPTPPDDYEVMTSFERSGDDGLQLQVAVMTSGSVDDLLAYYEEALTDAGFEIEQRNRIEQGGDVMATLGARGEEHGVLLQIVADDEGTMVNYGIGPADRD